MTGTRSAPAIATGRLEAFSDGVFAIAITLLVLDLKPGAVRGHVAHDLLHEWPSYVAYVGSFLYIGVVWVNHHALLTRIQSVDTGLLWANLGLLLAVSVLPFPTAQLAVAMRDGTHADRIAAMTLYCVLAAATGAAWLALYRHLHRHPELHAAHVPPHYFRTERRRAVFGMVFPAVPLVICLVAPVAALVVLATAPAFYALTADGLPQRRARRRAAEVD